MLKAFKAYSSSVQMLLWVTFILTLARAITLPYLVVYLADRFALSISDIGLVVGSALFVGSLLSLYGGYLIDKLRSYSMISSSTLIFAAAFVGAVASRSLLLFIAFLVLINLTLAVVDIAAKAGFCALLPENQRSEVFSIKYTLSNVAYAVGPFMGAGLFKLDTHWPFIVSAALGLAMFLVGLLGFSLAQSLLVWCLAMLVFTLGEIIVIPAEYMFIDAIAPEHLRGMYYGAQNLSNLGAALGPVICGFALAALAPQVMFYLLIICVVAATLFYYLGASGLGRRS